MDDISFRVLTMTTNVGPFDDCAVTELNQTTTEFSADAGLDFRAHFFLDCEAPYKIVDLLGITVAHGP